MLTPFDSEFAKHHILELPTGSGSWDIAECTNKMDFEKLLPWCRDEEDSDFSPVEEECLHEYGFVDEISGYEVWASACLYDAVVNGTDYALYCTGYAEEYQKAVEALRKALAKKKFLSRIPVHDLPEILQNAVDALDCVLDNVAGESELAGKMQENGNYEVFWTEILALQNRLSDHIELKGAI